jgi:hypothetical protein
VLVQTGEEPCAHEASGAGNEHRALELSNQVCEWQDVSSL